MKRIAIAIILVLGAGSAFAQSSRPEPVAAALSDSCNGLWQEVEAAIREVRLLHSPIDKQRAENLGCMLAAIDSTTFDARDSRMNEILASGATRLLVDIHGGGALDFFAGQLPKQSRDARRRLVAVLLEHGHPDAVREYFAVRRAHLNRNESWERESSAVLGVFGPILERGTCSAAVCSEHMAQTAQLVRANLDILDLELQAIEQRPTPRSESPRAVEEAEKVRAVARRVREQVGRIQRGETVVGTAPPAQ